MAVWTSLALAFGSSVSSVWSVDRSDFFDGTRWVLYDWIRLSVIARDLESQTTFSPERMKEDVLFAVGGVSEFLISGGTTTSDFLTGLDNMPVSAATRGKVTGQE